MLKTSMQSNREIYTSKDILCFLDEHLIKYIVNDLDEFHIETFCAFNELKNNAITWTKKLDDQVLYKINEYKNTVFLTDINNYMTSSTNVIYVEDLKSSFFKLIKHMFSHLDYDVKTPKIEDSAIVLTKNAGKNLYVGHQSFVDVDVILGDNVTILNHVVIQGNVKIGDNVIIESGTVIGSCGFGYYKNKDGKPEKVPHLGGVIIGNNVTIGAGNCISRGSLNDTIIEDNVKTDNLCHIAHSDHLKNGVMLAACAELSGSVTVGEDTWIAPGVTVINGAIIGSNVYTGIATNIVKDVPDNALIYGNPGKIKEK